MPLVGPCGASVGALPASAQPARVLPADTVELDYPLVQLSWPTGERTRDAAGAFARWVTGPAGRSALAGLGFQPPGAGVAPTARLGDLDTVLQRYRATKPPADVLIAVDASGSMGEPAPGGSGTRFTVVSRGVRDALDQMGRLDRFGLRVFPAEAVRHRPPAELRDLAELRVGDLRRRRAAGGLPEGVTPVGRTPLYDTVLAAIGVVRRGTNPTAAVVVLTDGDDTSSHHTAGEVATALERTQVRLLLVAVGEARCADQPLAKAAGAACVQADFGTVDGTLARLFGTLWGGN
jgi:Ca-activated chloride channel family protein